MPRETAARQPLCADIDGFSQPALFDGLVPQALPMLRDGTLDFAVSAPVADEREPDVAFEPPDLREMAVLCRRVHPLRHARSWGKVVDAKWLLYVAPGSQHSA